MYTEIIKGRILYIDKNISIKSIGNTIVLHQNNKSKTFALPGNILHKVGRNIELIGRFLRSSCHHAFFYENKIFLFVDRRLIVIDTKNSKCLYECRLSSSRPLVICKYSNKIYYGEYFSNPSRRPVKVLSFDLNSFSWTCLSKISEIRHIHGIFYDPYEDLFWMTTGDLDSECFIWKSKDLFSFEKVIGGSQKYRAVHLIFTEDSIYYGSDSPSEKNYLYRLNRKNLKTTIIAQVGGSVFYGYKSQNQIYFSTAVEPSCVNLDSVVEIWSICNDKAKKISVHKKDFFSMKYFQYGQAFFPYGSGDGESVYFTPFSTVDHLTSYRINL